jgi:WD40 repeat protein
MLRLGFLGVILSTLLAQHAHGQVIRELQRKEAAFGLEARLNPVFGVQFSADSQSLATVSLNYGEFHYWDVTSAKESFCLEGREGLKTAIAIAPGDEWVATGDVEGRIVLYRHGGLSTVQESGSCVFALAFSPDGRWLAACVQDGTIEIWEVSSGRRCQSIHPGRLALYALTFSPDGQHIATAGFDGAICIHDLISGEQLSILSGHTDAVYSLSFSPDGQTLASGSGDGTVRLWDPATGRQARCMRSQHDAIYYVGFAARGHRLLSVDTAGLVVLWNPADGAARYSHRLPGKIVCAALSPDGRHAAAGGAFGASFLIDLPPE